MKTWKRRFLKILYIGIGILILSATFIVVSGLIEDDAPKDIALVLGNKVNEDGTPSDRLAARLDRAAYLYDNDGCSIIIVSGAKGIEGHDEAVVMKNYLVQKGIPNEKVIVDSDGWNTWKSAVNAYRIADGMGLKKPSIVAVSQYFHLPRCRLLLKQAGFEDVASSYARYVEWRDVYSTAREIPAYGRYLILPKEK